MDYIFSLVLIYHLNREYSRIDIYPYFAHASPSSVRRHAK
jgi:hypothetical protein